MLTIVSISLINNRLHFARTIPHGRFAGNGGVLQWGSCRVSSHYFRKIYPQKRNAVTRDQSGLIDEIDKPLTGRIDVPACAIRLIVDPDCLVCSSVFRMRPCSEERQLLPGGIS